jgi:hypothetical protein
MCAHHICSPNEEKLDMPTHLKHENFARRFVNIEVAFGWIFGIDAGSSQEVNYIIWSIYISIIGCYLVK